MRNTTESLERPRALIGWRLLALVYDALPVVALWMAISALFTLGWDPLESTCRHASLSIL